MVSIAALIVIQAFVMMSCCIHILLDDMTGPSNRWYFEVLAVQTASVTVIDYVLNIILFSLFVRKLGQLVSLRLLLDANNSGNDSASILDHVTISRLLHVITKQTLLGISVTVINQSFATSAVIAEYNGSMTANEYAIIYLVRGGEGAMISFLMYLGLFINNDEYTRICGSCHDSCYHCTLKRARKQITRTYKINNAD